MSRSAATVASAFSLLMVVKSVTMRSKSRSSSSFSASRSDALSATSTGFCRFIADMTSNRHHIRVRALGCVSGVA
jgi:hypothetical protein